MISAVRRLRVAIAATSLDIAEDREYGETVSAVFVIGELDDVVSGRWVRSEGGQPREVGFQTIRAADGHLLMVRSAA